jgi:hypothetical protein
VKTITTHFCFYVSVFLLFPTLIYSQSCTPRTFKNIIYEADSSINGGYSLTSICISSDSSYLLSTGNFQLVNNADINGNITWTQSYDGFYGSIPYKADDGRYFILTAHGQLLNIDSNGSVLWQKNIVDTNCHCIGLKYIEQTVDGGFILTGSKYVLDSFHHNIIFVVKTNSVGDTLWNKTINNSSYGDDAMHTQQTSDGGYLVIQNIEYLSGVLPPLHQEYEIGVTKLDSTGQEQWLKVFHLNDFKWWDYQRTAAIQTIDNGCLVVSKIYSDTLLDCTNFLKIDENGNTIFDTTYSYKRFDGGITQTSDGGYLLGINGSLSKIDGDATNILWSKSFLGKQGENIPINSIKATCDNGYIFCGNTSVYDYTGGGCTAYDYYNYYSYLVKTDSTCDDLSFATGIENTIQNIANQVLAYPNPFSISATIEIKDFQKGKYELQIFDLSGREVLKSEIKNEKTEIQKGNLANGMYFYKVSNENNIVGTGKLIIE